MKIGTENMLVYRFNFFFRAAVSLIPLLATIYLWQTIYRGQKPEVAGYSLAAMISYYLLVTIVDTLTAVNEDDWQIAADIKDGNISQFLLKPIDYLAYRICLFLSGKLIFTAVSIVPVGIFMFCFRHYFVAPAGLGDDGVLSVVRLADGPAAILHVLHHGPAGVLAAGGFDDHLHSLCLRIHRGRTFVSAEHPAAGLETALNCTPFPYLLYFPVSVYLGQVRGAELWRGLAMQAGWVVAVLLVGAVGLGAGHPHLHGGGRMKPDETRNLPANCGGTWAFTTRSGAIPSRGR